MFSRRSGLVLLSDYMNPKHYLGAVANDVVFLSANSGHGHIKVAEALENKLASGQNPPSSGHLEVLEHANAFYRLGYNNLIINLVKNHPEAYGWLYEFFDKKHFSQTPIGRITDKLAAALLIDSLEKSNPKVIVATHYLTAQVAARLKAEGKITSEVIVVITDYYAHQQWIVDGADQYCVSSDEMKNNLKERGVEEDKITVTGIPVNQEFLNVKEKEREAACSELSLNPDKKYIFLTGGGLGLGASPEEIKSLLENLPEDVQLIVGCGTSKEAKKSLEDLITKNPELGEKLIIKGYLKPIEMAKLMHVSDLMIGKAGGGQVTEATLMGTPMILYPLPGQESHNAEFLQGKEAAIKVSSWGDAFEKAVKLLNGTAVGKTLEQMQQAATAIAKPDPTGTIVGLIRDALSEQN